jgi:hypothetical protein
VAHEDRITLNGQDYLIAGPVSGRAITEFSAGFKIGRATYDDREHAFFLVLDDFSGGVGFHRIDAHESLGGTWDNSGGVDIRRARHVTLPPQRSTLTGIPSPTAGVFGSDAKAMLPSDIGGTEFLWTAAGDKVYKINSTRTTATVAATLASGGLRRASAIPTLLEWRDPDTNTRRLYAFTINGALDSRYWYSSDGSAWTEGGRVVWDALVFDGKIVGAMPMPAGNPLGIPQGTIVCGYTSDGVNWNVDNASAAVARPKWFFQGLPRFIGVAMTPWGLTAPYFIDGGKLYVLDFYKERAIPIEEVGDKTRLLNGGTFEGFIWVSDGWNVWIYDPGREGTVRRVGIYNRFGVPPSLQGYTTAQFVGGTSTLYCIIEDNVNAKMRVLAYTGIGWTPVTPVITPANPIAAAVNRFPYGSGLTVPTRFLDILCNNNEGSSTLSLYSFKLPTTGDVPTPGDGFFEDGPLSFETGWYDGGFLDLQGALHRMHIDALTLSATETVMVEYRLNNDESAGWTLLGTFNNTTDTLWFDAANHRGIQFRTVQFRITLDRGSNATTTPELVALVLVYDKKPEFRSAWTFRIDVNRMVETQMLVGSQPATPLNIWQALKTAYDVKTLLPFVAPSMEPAGINVRIVDMPLTYDDFRTAVAGKGYIEVSLIQPVAG